MNFSAAKFYRQNFTDKILQVDIIVELNYYKRNSSQIKLQRSRVKIPRGPATVIRNLKYPEYVKPVRCICLVQIHDRWTCTYVDAAASGFRSMYFVWAPFRSERGPFVFGKYLRETLAIVHEILITG